MTAPASTGEPAGAGSAFPLPDLAPTAVITPPAGAGGPGGATASGRTAAPGSATVRGEEAAARPTARGGGRLRALDGLRLVAALAVCGYHYAGRDGDITHAWGTSPKHLFPSMAGALSYGCLGVQLFFIISGFVICMSGWGRSLRAFAASRASRLMPAYWFALLLIAGVAVLPGVDFPGAKSLSDMLTNLTMLQSPVGAHRVLGVCWTLWAEARFYLLFAVCVLWRGATRGRVLTFCVLWTAAAVLVDGGGKIPLASEIVMPQYAPYFVGGMALYLIYRFGHDAMAWSVVGISWLLGQHYAVRELVAPAATATFHHRSQLAVITVVTLAFVLVAVVTLTPLGGVGGRWLTTAGALTYPFYLVHEHLGWVVIGALHHGLRLPAPLVLALCVVLMLTLAWLIHTVVERRATPLIRRALLGQAGTSRRSPS